MEPPANSAAVGPSPVAPLLLVAMLRLLSPPPDAAPPGAAPPGPPSASPCCSPPAPAGACSAPPTAALVSPSIPATLKRRPLIQQRVASSTLANTVSLGDWTGRGRAGGGP